MNDASHQHRDGDDARLAILLLWLCGIALRLTILAVPPVLASIRDEFALRATEVAVLGSIAPALFALASLASAFIVSHVGVRTAMIGGLALVALGSALRGASGNFAALFATSVVMAAGVAIMQPLMPTAVRSWSPKRIGFATAVYTNGLLVGEIIPVWLTAPFVLPAVGGSWRAVLVAWSVPIVLTAIVVHAKAPAASAADTTATQWMPDWTSALVWRLGIILGCCNAMYFGANTFIPVFLASRGETALVPAALTALNLGQLPASFLLLAFASAVERRAWPYLAASVLAFTGTATLALASGTWIVAGAALLGFSAASVLILGLTLPALLCPPSAVTRTAAAMFTVSYAGAVAVAVIGGMLWDLVGRAELAFAPIAFCAALLIAATFASRAAGELR